MGDGVPMSKGGKRPGREFGWHQFKVRSQRRQVRRKKRELEDKEIRLQGMGTYSKLVDAMIYLET